MPLIRDRAHGLAHLRVAEAHVADLDTGVAGLLLCDQRALCRAEQSLTPPTCGPIVTRPTTEDVCLSLTEGASRGQPDARAARRRPEEGWRCGAAKPHASGDR